MKNKLVIYQRYLSSNGKSPEDYGPILVRNLLKKIPEKIVENMIDKIGQVEIKLCHMGSGNRGGRGCSELGA